MAFAEARGRRSVFTRGMHSVTEGGRAGLAPPTSAPPPVMIHAVQLGFAIGRTVRDQRGVGAAVTHGEVSTADMDGLHGG